MSASAFETAFERVQELAATFHANVNRYLSPGYQEAEVRKDFIDKFFMALGWDVNHDVQTNPYEQEVKVEPSVAASGQRRADYAFFLAPNYRDVRFFVEAKKPYGDIATKENYFQVIRYGWNSETPLAVLTDFEQFHVIDCRYKPDVDTALNRAAAKFHYSDYNNRKKFEEIYWLFSREAVADGSLEKRAKELPKAKGVAARLRRAELQSLDEAFLEDLDAYRTDLAKAFKKHNARLDSEQLTEATQRALDRLVFIRFLEDKGIEAQRLVDKFGDKGTAWEDFIATSRRLDGIYNGIVFKDHPLLDKPGFRVDDDTFVRICKKLAHVNSPYDFNAIPIHILGSIYERFLGKVIVATDKRVKVEEKPEVRKAGGVYYTPEYIVRYIVENTVGKLIAGKTPDQIAEMRFADIACGSGSFLLGVYDLLLAHHGNYYNQNPGKAKKGDCIERDGKLYLSLRKKRDILLNNIYGVDIDAQAVEVCQLSLYLKLLKDETTVTAHQYLLDFEKQALLPSLNKNIVCGNSLIGRDIIDGQLFAGDEERKLNPMNFEDAFPHIFGRQPGMVREPAAPYGDWSHEGGRRWHPDTTDKWGGFDAIVGNPPYVRMEEFSPIKAYLRSHYNAHEERADFYTYFIERALTLINSHGLVGMIVSNKFSVAKYGQPLRETIQHIADVKEIADFAGANVFKGATIRTFVLTMGRQDHQQAGKTRYVPVPNPDLFAKIEAGQLTVVDYANKAERFLAVGQLSASPWELLSSDRSNLLHRLTTNFPSLRDSFDWHPLFGIKTGLNEAFVIDEPIRRRLIREDKKSADVIRPFLFGKDVKRYSVESASRYVIYLHPDKQPKNYPAVRRHLETFRAALSQRAASQEWYELQQPAVSLIPLLAKPKIVYPIIAPEPRFALDDRGFLVNDKLFVLPTDSLFLLGILNSALGHFFFSSVCARLEGSGDCYYEYRAQFVERFPVCPVNLSKSADKSRHDEMVAKVEEMLAAKKALAAAKSDKDTTYYENKCAALDRQIDRLVYDLYGLTEAEIAIVEGTEK